MSLRACAICLAALLLLLLPARIEIQDEEVFLNTALNILANGLPVYTADGLAFYQRYSPVYASILALHLAVVQPVGEALAQIAPAHGGLLGWGLVLSFNVLVTVLLFLLVARSLPGPPALWLLALTSSFTLFYATTLFMDVLIMVLLFLSSLLASRGRWFACGLGFALLGMLKITNLVYVPALVLLIAAAPGRLNRPRGRTTLIALATAIGIPVAFHAAFNVFVRGNLADFGYAPVYPDPLTGAWLPQGFHHPPWRGLAGFLISPGKSLLLYAPLVIPGVAGLWIGWRRGDVLARIAAVHALVTVALYSAWSQWEGGMCYGPRLLLPAVPLVLTGLAWIDLPRHRVSLAALAALGVGVNVSARILPIFPAYLASGAYGTGTSFPLAHNFLADHLGAVTALPAALAGHPPVNLVPALLATNPTPMSLPLLALWGACIATLVIVPVVALARFRPDTAGQGGDGIAPGPSHHEG